MLTELQQNLPPSHVERGIEEKLMPTLVGTHQKPLKEMLVEWVGRLQRSEQVNIHEYCCGMGVAVEQIQLLLNALCVAADVRSSVRAVVVGSDINPLNEERLNPGLEDYHAYAWAYLRYWSIPGVDVEALQRDSALQGPQASFLTVSADQPIEHPGPLDFAFCMDGIWYVDNKLAMVFNMVEALRRHTGLAVVSSIDLDSVSITHIEGGAWQGRYRLRDFLADHGNQEFTFHLEPGGSAHTRSIYTLCARRTNNRMGPMPEFTEAVPANAPSTVRMPCWDYVSFRRQAKYRFET